MTKSGTSFRNRASKLVLLLLVVVSSIGFNVPIYINSCQCSSESCCSTIAEPGNQCCGSNCDCCQITNCCTEKECYADGASCSCCCLCGFLTLPALEPVVFQTPIPALKCTSVYEIYSIKPPSSYHRVVREFFALPLRLHAVLSVWLN